MIANAPRRFIGDNLWMCSMDKGSGFKAAIGARGEDVAVGFLVENGYNIIKRNYRCRYGEVDIIAEDGLTLAFIEVKTRGSALFGAPQGSVDSRKQARIIRSACVYMEDEGIIDRYIRFDVVSVMRNKGRYTAEIFKGAFEAGDDTFSGA